MKKIIILIALALNAALVSFAFAGAVETGGTITGGAGESVYGSATDGATANGALLGRLSKGVQLGVAYTNSAYTLTTKHLTGSKQFGTGYNSTSIYSFDSPSGTAVTAPSSNDATTAFAGAGWTAM